MESIIFTESIQLAYSYYQSTHSFGDWFVCLFQSCLRAHILPQQRGALQTMKFFAAKVGFRFFAKAPPNQRIVNLLAFLDDLNNYNQSRIIKFEIIKNKLQNIIVSVSAHPVFVLSMSILFSIFAPSTLLCDSEK